MSFEDLGVMPELIRGVAELGWVLPTPIQAETIPLILGGGDMLAAAETGSGLYFISLIFCKKF
jgi:ATP-dependent RNA helicase DDX1